MLDHLCSAHAVDVSVVMATSVPYGTTFAGCGDVPTPEELMGTQRTPLGFILERPLKEAKWSREKAAALGRLGMPQPGMSAHEP